MARRQWTFAGVTAAVMLAAAGCGGGAGSGGGGAAGDDLAEAAGYETAEGSATAPLAIGDLGISPVVQYDGKVGNGTTTGGTSYYLVEGATPGVEYTVTMANLTDDADALVYQGDPTYTSTPTERTTDGKADEAVTFSAAQDVTTLYLVVEGDKTAKGATFTMSVSPKPKSEGSITDQVDLYSDLPVSRPGSTVGHGATAGIGGPGDSYYKYEVPADTVVMISLSNPTADADLYVAFDTAFTDFDSNNDATADITCQNIFGGAVSEACIVNNNPTGGVDAARIIYIGVDGFDADEGAAYTLNITKAPVGAGVSGTPCDLGNAPKIWDHTFVSAPCGSFPLSVSPGGEVGIDSTAVSATATDDSYYVIGGLTSGKTYILTLEDATDYAGLYVYRKGATYTTPVCEPTADEIEDAKLPKVQRCVFDAFGTTVHVAVDGSQSLLGAAFKLTLFPEFVPTGTLDIPAPIAPTGSWAEGVAQTFTSLTTGPDTVLGIVGATSPAPASAFQPLDDVPAGTIGDAYFTISQLDIGETYIVRILDMTDDLNLYVFSDSGYTNEICRSLNGGVKEDRCVVKATTSSLYVAVDGYFAKDGAGFSLQVEEQQLKGDNDYTNTGAKPVGGAPLKFKGKVVGGGTAAIGTGEVQDSYYAVAVKRSQAYKVTLTDFKPDLKLDVRNGSTWPNFSTAGTTGVFCEPVPKEGAEESCIINNAADTADPEDGDKYIMIGVDGSAGEADTFYSFVVYVEETAPVVDVSSLIKSVTVSDPPLESALPKGTDKIKGISFDEKSLDAFYSVSLPAGGKYRIGISKLSGDANLFLFGKDDTFTKPVSTTTCPNTQLGQDKTGYLNEYCDVSTTKETAPITFYFAVDGYFTFGSGAKYVVSVEPL